MLFFMRSKEDWMEASRPFRQGNQILAFLTGFCFDHHENVLSHVGVTRVSNDFLSCDTAFQTETIYEVVREIVAP